MTHADRFAGTISGSPPSLPRVAGLIILLTGWARADAVAALIVAALMAKAGWELYCAEFGTKQRWVRIGRP